MQILILTSLFPPDPGETAQYVKELASNFTEHSVSILLYGQLPESIAGVSMHTVSKRRTLLRRIIAYTYQLYRQQKTADIIIVHNAPATELPILLISLVTKIHFIVCESDTKPLHNTSRSYRIIHSWCQRRAAKTIALTANEPWQRIEWLPDQTPDEAKQQKRVAWWEEHVNEFLITPYDT